MEKYNKNVWEDIHAENLKESHNIENTFPSKCAQSFFMFHVYPFLIKQGNACLLEIGCGTGGNLGIFNRSDIILKALDTSENALSKAKKRFKNNVEFLKGTSSKLPVDDSSQDFVLADGCLYYSDSLEEYKKSFDEIFRVLKDGGLARIYDKANDDMVVNEKNKKSKYIYYAKSKWEKSMPIICPSKDFLLEITEKFSKVVIGKEKFNHVDDEIKNQHSFWVLTLEK